MSLLLAAPKNSAEDSAKPNELAALQLEEAQVSSAPQSDQEIEAILSTSKINTARAEEANLFAAKILPPKKRLQWGIVPIALIVAAILAVAGSLYVYHQITPPSPTMAHLTAPAPLVTAPAILLPLAPMPVVALPVVVADEASLAAHTAKTTQAETTQVETTTLNIRHRPESDSIDPILSDAYQAYQTGDYTTAEQHYRDALTQDQNNSDALLGLAAIAQQQGKDDAAIQFYHRILALDPHDPVAQAALTSLTPAEAGNKEFRFKQLIAQQPESAALHFALGNQYAEQSRWIEAQQAYFNAYTAEPSSALFAFSLAISLDHLGQSNTAAQYYRQALQLDTSGNSGFTREQVQQRLNQLGSH
jgi:Tfp pilus assembly protein PilF